ncbi:hypothetical protein L6R53_29920, partial [Myxococcota bacterium]|nr:hypothetical protein [Myxococcota bacterium]
MASRHDGDRKDEGDSASDGGRSERGARTSSRVERQGSARPHRQGRRERGDDSRRDDTRRAENFLSEVMELQQGILHAGIEAASTGIDTATRVTRNTVDRAFSRDFRDPGDVLRNLGKDADETARDVLDGHEINEVRRDLGRNGADVVWLWGPGGTALLHGHFDAPA